MWITGGITKFWPHNISANTFYFDDDNMTFVQVTTLYWSYDVGTAKVLFKLLLLFRVLIYLHLEPDIVQSG